jgi:hypothetical protein
MNRITDWDEDMGDDIERAAGHRPTNIETVTAIMEYSRFGAPAQAFVMDALMTQAKAVADAPPEAFASMRGGFVSSEAWQGVAREIADKLKQHFDQ